MVAPPQRGSVARPARERTANRAQPANRGAGGGAACAVDRVNPDEGIRPIIGYLLALVFGLIVVAAVPWISIDFLE